MTKSLARLCSVLVVTYAVCGGGSIAAASAFVFETVPAGGSIEGEQGSTIGWGYALSNPSATDWLVTTSLNADLFSDGVATALFDLPMLAPGATVSVAYDALNFLGLYELTWDLTAPVGSVNNGTFVLSAEWWDGDPFAGGTFLDFAAADTAAYSAAVVQAPASDPIPEPSTLLLLATGLSARHLYSKRSRRQRKDAS